jgi:DMSO/TMAO reductase YedYZ heme-binding membrane subunit
MLKPNSKYLFVPIITASYLFVLLIASFNLTLSVKAAIYFALLYLMLALLPTRLLRWNLFSKLQIKLKLAWLLARRKQFGISAGFMVLLHSGLAIFLYSGIRQGLFFLPFYYSREIILGVLAETVFIIMLITSIEVIISKLGKYWKPIHRFVWLAVGFATLHSQIASTSYIGRNSIIALGLFGILIVFAVFDLIQALIRKRDPKIAILTLVLLSTGLAIGLIVFFSGS